ncbi:MAG: hydroxyacid dehydrogenase [Kiritimatiellae bacterium]|nr:hydroxyacid dehydrogenase [Verrucomicrobiota bacterium]MCG2659531.1 hydroxyacid dehydrogenase [Kiritimatiellia bacterium]
MRAKVYIHRLGSWYPCYMTRENEALLESFAEVVTEGDRESSMSPDELTERMRGCAAILSMNGTGNSEITAEVLKAVGTVKAIAIAHYWGDLLVKAAAGTGIQVVEGSNANTIAVAEWTVGAALMGVREFLPFDRALRAGTPWPKLRLEPSLQTDARWERLNRPMSFGLLCGSTVGLVGLGRIGWYAAHYFRALGATVIAYDKYYSPQKAERLGVRLVGLDKLMTTAGVVSIHLPVTDETRGMIGAREFAMIRNGAVFINSARAAVYDEEALIAELRKERFCAYLDVFAEEPLPPTHPFRSMRNVVMTPHIAGCNAAMLARCGREAILTLKDYFDGKGLRNLQYWYPYSLNMKEPTPWRN